MENSFKIILTPITAVYSYLPNQITSKIEIPCLIKTFLGCECPGCGITRGIKSFMNLNFKEAINYNLLTPFVLLIIVYLSIAGTNKLYKKQIKI
jgi:hypothetical protein